MVAWHCIRLNVYTSLYVSVQAKGQQGPPNCHCVSTVPAGIGRNTQAVDKNIQWIKQTKIEMDAGSKVAEILC